MRTYTYKTPCLYCRRALKHSQTYFEGSGEVFCSDKCGHAWALHQFKTGTGMIQMRRDRDMLLLAWAIVRKVMQPIAPLSNDQIALFKIADDIAARKPKRQKGGA